MLTSDVERSLVSISGGSPLSCSFGRLAIGGSSNCPGTIGKRRC